MRKWAFMRGDVIDNTTLSDDAPEYQGQVAIEIPSHVGVGWKLVGGQWQYGRPDAPIPVDAVVSRFTVAEYDALYALQENNSATVRAKAKAIIDYMRNNDFLRTSDDKVNAGFTFLEQQGVLAPGRRNQILF